MEITSLMFYIFAGLTVGSALLILFTKNVLYGAFLLVITFFGIAALYVMTGAEFLAITQILVYVGGVLVLLIFGIMLSHRISGQPVVSGQHNQLPAFIFSVLLLAIHWYMISKSTFFFQQANFNTENASSGDYSAVKLLGFQLMTNFVLPFEMVAIILLVALIGAAFLARRQSV